MHFETWLKVNCPKCNENNWICNGDVSDITIPDIEAVSCWNCKKKFWLDDLHFSDLEDEDSENKSMDDAYVEEGKKSPF